MGPQTKAARCWGTRSRLLKARREGEQTLPKKKHQRAAVELPMARDEQPYQQK